MTASDGSTLIARQPDLGPGMCRHYLADALAQARRACGLTQQQARAKLEWSSSKVARIEAAENGITVTDLRAALRLYGVHDPGEVARLETLARAARRRPWYHRYHAVITADLGRYLDGEHAATVIHGYRARAIPGLLQTPGYARALLLACGMDAVRERMALLAHRQELLDSPHCPVITYVIDEAAMVRPIGGHAIMDGQLDHLSHIAATHPRIAIRALPLARGVVPPADTLTAMILPDGAVAAWHGALNGRLAPCDLDTATRHRLTQLLALSLPWRRHDPQ